MKTKVVYVLVSQESDYYYEMLLLSYYSLRLHHPKDDTEVLLVMDTETNRRLIDKKSPIINEVTPIVVDIPGEYTVMQRSRYLKTTLRQRVHGNFLYLDCDTLICEPLNEIDKTTSDIAMVFSNNRGGQRSGHAKHRCEKAGFYKLENQPYYNGGVIYSKSSPTSNQFFELWHQLWNYSLMNGIPQDQPALCQTNMDLKHPIEVLSDIWNCQILYRETDNIFQKAKIIHYYCKESLVRSMILQHIKKMEKPDTLFFFIINNPRTIGYLLFTMSDTRLEQYVSQNNLFNLKERNPPFFRLMIPFSRILEKPVRIISKIM